VEGVDAGGPFSRGEFASPRSVFDRVTSPVPSARMTVTEGFYDRTLPGAENRPVAVAWIDCDLYESTVPVLDFLTDGLQDGSVLPSTTGSASTAGPTAASSAPARNGWRPTRTSAWSRTGTSTGPAARSS
jgi:hypothetical protein